MPARAFCVARVVIFPGNPRFRARFRLYFIITYIYILYRIALTTPLNARAFTIYTWCVSWAAFWGAYMQHIYMSHIPSYSRLENQIYIREIWIFIIYYSAFFFYQRWKQKKSTFLSSKVSNLFFFFCYLQLLLEHRVYTAYITTPKLRAAPLYNFASFIICAPHDYIYTHISLTHSQPSIFPCSPW